MLEKTIDTLKSFFTFNLNVYEIGLLFYFFIFSFIIWWAYCGYLLTIYIFSIFSSNEKSITLPNKYPTISIIIPCYNEEALVSQKLQNLREIDYPTEKITIWFLDGCSNDMTVNKLESEAHEPYIKIVKTGCKGKINQINHILPKIDAEIIVSTDMDAILARDTLIKIVKEFESDPFVYVVGANVTPKDAFYLEELYWEAQNVSRILESNVYSSSIVIAPCYAYRKDLLDRFPDDCVADDIYVSYLANVKNFKTKYSESAIVYETRVPKDLKTFLNHKFRKANAFIIEALRFIYLLPYMRNRWKMIFLTKMLQVVFLPWILAFFISYSFYLFVIAFDLLKIGCITFLFMFISFEICHLIINRLKGQHKIKKIVRNKTFAIFLFSNLILFAAGLSYPFFKQKSTYSKI